MVSPFLISPSKTRIKATTPLYSSYLESKIKARAVSPAESRGGNPCFITACKISSTPSPVLPEAHKISSSEQPSKRTISAFVFGTFAAGKSILLTTGIIVKSCSNAKYRLARVWA